MVGAVEDVPEAGHDEAQRRLVPARIELHEAGIAVELERADGAAGRQEAQRRRDLAAEPVDARMDREFGAVGADRIFEQHVEQLLVPVEVEVVGEPRPCDVRERLLVGGERPVRRQRHARMRRRAAAGSGAPFS